MADGLDCSGRKRGAALWPTVTVILSVRNAASSPLRLPGLRNPPWHSGKVATDGPHLPPQHLWRTECNELDKYFWTFRQSTVVIYRCCHLAVVWSRPALILTGCNSRKIKAGYIFFSFCDLFKNILFPLWSKHNARSPFSCEPRTLQQVKCKRYTFAIYPCIESENLMRAWKRFTFIWFI